ncbi:hypothetical protein J6590_002668 [Homalodisca vitripennis]|nr:hypothetical protein J6590_002668 [Homalodisca vitripennis]
MLNVVSLSYLISICEFCDFVCPPYKKDFIIRAVFRLSYLFRIFLKTAFHRQRMFAGVEAAAASSGALWGSEVSPASWLEDGSSGEDMRDTRTRARYHSHLYARTHIAHAL